MYVDEQLNNGTSLRELLNTLVQVFDDVRDANLVLSRCSKMLHNSLIMALLRSPRKNFDDILMLLKAKHLAIWQQYANHLSIEDIDIVEFGLSGAKLLIDDEHGHVPSLLPQCEDVLSLDLNAL
uniref:Uncharacterized protein n=1 Tax=Glossina pallidipes TaxID=7398 RepID=A0A1A9ZUS9_GLOPL